MTRQNYHQKLCQLLLSIVLGLFLISCGGTPKPSISLSPTPDIIKKAIALQVEQTQKKLTEQLEASHPDLKISHINVNSLEQLYLGHLPTYHLQGKYNLDVDLPNQSVTQEDNIFDIYLQRQQEGKTWRWLKPETRDEDEEDSPHRWRSYRVR